MCVAGRTRAAGQKTDGAAGKRGSATIAAATDQQEAVAPKITNTSEKLGTDDPSATRGVGRMTGDRAE